MCFANSKSGYTRGLLLRTISPFYICYNVSTLEIYQAKSTWAGRKLRLHEVFPSFKASPFLPGSPALLLGCSPTSGDTVVLPFPASGGAHVPWLTAFPPSPVPAGSESTGTSLWTSSPKPSSASKDPAIPPTVQLQPLDDLRRV